MKLYQALYNDCIHESAYGTISIHLTKEGAENAIKEHKEKEEAQYNAWNKVYAESSGDGIIDPYEVQSWQAWCIDEIEVLP